MAPEYIERLTDDLVRSRLSTFGALLVVGPKWCGKTTSAARLAASQFRLMDPTGRFQNRRLATIDPAQALRGPRPRLVDEWQEVPEIWDAVRFECDEAGGVPGQFILTGSTVPHPQHEAGGDLREPMHSGAGRIGRLKMSTLTQAELGTSSGAISLAALMQGEGPEAVQASSASLASIATAVCHGGWPASAALSVSQSMELAYAYLDAVATSDVSRVDGVRRDPQKVSRLICSLARNESTLASNKALRADLNEEAIADSTLRDYLSALRSIYFIEDVPAWSPALRSPVRLRSSAKRHLADPSLAAAALGATPNSLVNDLKTLGLLFESLVLHDLSVYAQTFGGSVMHYRDDSDLEVDAIVTMPGGDWGAFEIKLGSAQEDDAARSVNALARKMTERGERPPTVRAVVVGVGGIGYQRDDGVAVVPFDQLGA